MQKLLFLGYLTCLLFNHHAVTAQNNCNQKLLIGEWKFTSPIHWGIQTNIDSLRTIAQQDTAIVASIQFNEDGTYVYKFSNGTKQRSGFFNLNMSNCEILRSNKKKKLTNSKFMEHHNWEIIHIDSEILVYKEDNNPKTYATHVLVKN
jgi:hypothetical protein